MGLAPFLRIITNRAESGSKVSCETDCYRPVLSIPAEGEAENE